jgi:hypothetical protein
MATFFAELRVRNIHRVVSVCGVLLGCATPDYELPSNGEASVQPAIIEGTAYQVGYRYTSICVYPIEVDGQRVGLEADCTAAIPISPGKHIIVSLLPFGTKATLTFDATEGHSYKISMAMGNGQRAVVWISDEATQKQVTEPRQVILGNSSPAY